MIDNTKNKHLLILLPIAFVIGILLILVIYRFSSSSTSISLPVTGLNLIPTEIQLLPTPTIPPDLINLGNNLDSIEKDINSVKKEDRRLIPPEYILDLGI